MSAVSGNISSFCINIIGTTIKTMVVWYLVHWKWNRFDISLDAIIKFTAAGFLLASFMSIIIEQLIMITLSPIAILLIVYDISEVDTEGMPLNEWLQDPKNIQDMMQGHLGQAAIMAFVFSFIVAAFVEELMKYMTYWMTEVPDLLKLQDLGLQQHGDPTNDECKIRRAGATTIAMVAVATGFAWSENIGYIRNISSNPTGIGVGTSVWMNELTLLVFRSIMPVHELCAAIQSIGIVRRDIEDDRTWKLGRGLFPAIMLHGMYDFVAIFGGVLQQVIASKNDDKDGGNANHDDENAISPVQMLKAFVMVAPIVLVGAGYYYHQAKNQRQRLEGTEGTSVADDIRRATSSMQVILEEENEDDFVEGSGEDLEAPLLEAMDAAHQS